MDSSTNSLALRLASFINEALELDENPASLAAEILPFKRDSNAGISTIELDSSVGVAAFLIYHYLLSESDESGRSGSDIFQADLKTLERAAKLDTPGPRIMAHAVAGEEAYILATTPATHRALTGSSEAAEVHGEPELPAEVVRQESAAELLQLLKAANSQARAWLAAIRHSDGDELDDLIEFNPDETGLALFLLDDSNIRQLLQVLNLMIQSARSQSIKTNGTEEH